MSTSLPGTSQSDGLEEHREFIGKVRAILSGNVGLYSAGNVVYVYRIPSEDAGLNIEEVRNTGLGELTYGSGEVFAEENGNRKKLVSAVSTPQEGVDFLSDIRHEVERRRWELAKSSNEEHNREAATPGGRKGHLLKEYDNLLDLIKHEHYKHDRDRQSTPKQQG